jgi:hypothetical protein
VTLRAQSLAMLAGIEEEITGLQMDLRTTDSIAKETAEAIFEAYIAARRAGWKRFAEKAHGAEAGPTGSSQSGR